MMWPFKNRWKELHDNAFRHWGDVLTKLEGARNEISDLKDSNARLADALAAAKERAGDTW